MASMADLPKQVHKFTIDNSPFILTAMATAGVIATGVLAAKGGLKAARLIEEHEKKSNGLWVASSYKEKAQLTWKCYLPAVSVGVLSCGAIVFANQIGTRRAAAVASALTISEKAFGEYREKVVQHVGEKAEKKVKDEVAQDRFNENLDKASTVIVTGPDQLCFDSYSARYFKSTMEDLKHAVNRLNHQIISNDYASLSDFYDALGLEHTQVSDDVGWNVDKLLDVEFSAVIGPESKPAIAMTYRVEPIRDYFRLH